MQKNALPGCAVRHRGFASSWHGPESRVADELALLATETCEERTAASTGWWARRLPRASDRWGWGAVDRFLEWVPPGYGVTCASVG